MPQSASKNINAYIKRLPDWQKKICVQLRKTIHAADPHITEEWKWNSPAFSHNGLVCMFWSATEWVKLTFLQGALIQDKYKTLTDTSNDKSRSIRFFDVKEISVAHLKEYVKQSVANNVADKKVKLKPEPKHPIDLSPQLQQLLREKNLTTEFKQRPYYQQKGYLEWIDQAKREETKKNRIAIMVKELRQGTYMPPKS